MKKLFPHKSDCSSAKFEAGATFVEFAFIAPIVLLVLFGIFYFTLYYTVRGVVYTGANRALSLASVIPDLDIEFDPSNPADDPLEVRFDAAKAAVLARARELPDNSLSSGLANISSVTLILPDGDPSLVPAPKRREGLKSYPMQVVVTANLPNIIPFFPSPAFEVRAIGYREPRFNSSLPVAYDCLGTPLGYRDSNSDGMPDLPSSTECACAAAGKSMPTCNTSPISTYASGACGCGCWSGYKAVDADCVCPDSGAKIVALAGKTPIADCSPFSEPCPAAGQTRDSTRCCNCSCPGNQVPVDGVCACASDCKGTIVGGSACGCDCTEKKAGCPAPWKLDGKCNCLCPAPFSEDDGKCICKDVAEKTANCALKASATGGDWSFSSGSCSCQCLKTAASCASNQKFNSTNCTCDWKVVG